MSWQVSAYPVILSLENHCSQEQQEVMAQYLISILGDKLLKAPLDHPTTGDLPSPNVRLSRRTHFLLVNQKENLFNLRAGRGTIMFVHTNPVACQSKAKQKEKGPFFHGAEGLIRLFLCLSPPLWHRGGWMSAFASFNLSDPQNLVWCGWSWEASMILTMLKLFSSPCLDFDFATQSPCLNPCLSDWLEKCKHSHFSLLNMTTRMKGFSLRVDECVLSRQSFFAAPDFCCFGIYWIKWLFFISFFIFMTWRVWTYIWASALMVSS